MRNLLSALILLLLLASPAWGGWVSEGELLTDNDKGAKSTWAAATTFTLAVDELGVCVLAVDNISTGGGETSDHTSVTDAGSNVWVKRGEFSNTAGGAAACTVSVWTTVAGTAIGPGDITFNILSNRTAWAATCESFSMTVGDEATERGQTNEEQDNTDPGNLTSATVADIEHLWIHGMCGETNDTAYTASSTYTAFTFTSSTTTGGGSAGNVAARAGWDIHSGTTNDNDPAWADAPDFARILLAFEETTAAAPTRSRVIDIQ